LATGRWRSDPKARSLSSVAGFSVQSLIIWYPEPKVAVVGDP
jgi:hypothetical protein